VQFDQDAKPIPNSTNSQFSKDWILAALSTLFFIGGVVCLSALMALMIRPPDTRLQTVASPVTIVSPVSVTPTIPLCEPFVIEVGDVCRFRYTPTPVGVCPPTSDGGYCIYDGPLSLRPRSTATPTSAGPGVYAGGSITSATPYPRGN